MNNVRAKKYLGQHFLKDQNIARKITDSLLPLTKGVLEIGPGTGVLTRLLFERTEFTVLAIDVDKESIEFLHEELPTHKPQIILGDFLKANVREFFPAPFSIIGNLPYNISSQIFFRVIENRDIIPQVVCMLQKEVAERIMAKIKTKDYGRISVLSQLLCKVEKLFDLNPECFVPAPKIWSSVLLFTPLHSGLSEKDIANIEHLTTLAFGQRRKMIRQSLKSIPNIEQICLDLDISPTMRAEELTPEQYLALARHL